MAHQPRTTSVAAWQWLLRRRRMHPIVTAAAVVLIAVVVVRGLDELTNIPTPGATEDVSQSADEMVDQELSGYFEIGLPRALTLALAAYQCASLSGIGC